MAAGEMLNKEARDDLSAISLSRQILCRRTEQMSENLLSQLQMKIDEFVCCSIALDESTDNRQMYIVNIITQILLVCIYMH